MSHFSVLVIGEAPREQLQAFHQFECTGEDDRFVRDVDETADVQKDIVEMGLEKALDWHGLKERTVTSEAEVDRSGPHKYGYAILRDGALIRAVRRTNPDKKWDWHVLGGRWKGMLLLKDGRSVDQAECRHIDFRGLRDRAEQKAIEQYRAGKAALGDAPEPRTWEALREDHPDDIDAARKAFASQPAYERARHVKELLWPAADGDLHEYYWPESRWIDRARRNALVTFAVLQDGKWYERGRMGWWGVVHDEKGEDEWVNQFNSLFETLPPETLVSVFDCHI